MKQLIFILAIGLTGMVSAQTAKNNEPTVEQKAENLTQKMKKSLNLTEQQIPKVKEANIKMIQEKENLKAETQRRKKELHENHRIQLNAILTSEQMKKADDLMKKKEKKMKRKHKDE